MQGRARIVLRPDVIVLRTPLPPLVNPSGIVVEVADAKTEIDARALAAGPIFDVDAPNSVISGVKMLHAPEQAVLLRADAFRLVGATIVDCDEALHVADNVDNLIVESTRFENNRLGVQQMAEYLAWRPGARGRALVLCRARQIADDCR